MLCVEVLSWTWLSSLNSFHFEGILLNTAYQSRFVQPASLSLIPCLDGRNYSLPPRVCLLLHGFRASNSNFHICKANTFLFIFGFISFETGFLCSPGLELRDLLTSTSWMLELKECVTTTVLQEPFISPLYVITTFLFSHWVPVRIFLVSGLSTYI